MVEHLRPMARGQVSPGSFVAMSALAGAALMGLAILATSTWFGVTAPGSWFLYLVWGGGVQVVLGTLAGGIGAGLAAVVYLTVRRFAPTAPPTVFALLIVILLSPLPLWYLMNSLEALGRPEAHNIVPAALAISVGAIIAPGLARLLRRPD